MECSGRTQPSAPGWAERSPHRIDFGQGNALTTSGTSSADHLDRRPARLLDHRHVEVALLVGLDRGLLDRLEPGGAHEALDGAGRRADARALLLLLHVGLPDRHALHREREAARGDEGLGALIDEPASTSRSVTSLRKSSAARACMRAGISSENNSSRRSGMGVTADGARR